MYNYYISILTVNFKKSGMCQGMVARKDLSETAFKGRPFKLRRNHHE
jgi:hypothetical protein